MNEILQLLSKKKSDNQERNYGYLREILYNFYVKKKYYILNNQHLIKETRREQSKLKWHS